MKRSAVKRFREWNSWRKHSLNSPVHKFLVLLGVVKSPTFEVYVDPDELYNAFTKGMMKGVNEDD